jgi:hypothetical protein
MQSGATPRQQRRKRVGELYLLSGGERKVTIYQTPKRRSNPDKRRTIVKLNLLVYSAYSHEALSYFCGRKWTACVLNQLDDRLPNFNANLVGTSAWPTPDQPA